MRRTSVRRNNRFLDNKNLKSDNFKVIQPEEIEIGFDDIIGHKECKKELSTLLRFLESPEKYEQYGVLPYCKYLFVGPPGAGKNTFAYSIAKTAMLPIIVVETSFFLNIDNIMEEIDLLFAEVCSQLRKSKNCILLFKEIHYIGHIEPEIKQPILEKLLGYFRNFPQLVSFATISSWEDVTVYPLLLEKPAFNKTLQFFPPELKVREEIIQSFLKGIPTENGLNIHRLALDTYQMTTGDLKQLVKNAALLCLQNDQEKISYNHFAEAVAQSSFGYAKGKLSEEERLATARHEAGHVIAGYFSAPNTYKVSKVEITPRSFYLGITQETVDEDKKSLFKEDLEKQIITFLGGMASEDYYYNTTSVGVENDLEEATLLAIGMFKCFGMSSETGPICLEASVFSSQALNTQTDLLIQKYLKDMYDNTLMIILEHSDALEELTQALLANEVVYSEEVMAILKKYNK